jgi:hypothetical protein
VPSRMQVLVNVGPTRSSSDATCLVRGVAHTLEPKTRTNSVVLDVANPNLRLASGVYAEVLWRGADELR